MDSDMIGEMKSDLLCVTIITHDADQGYLQGCLDSIPPFANIVVLHTEPGEVESTEVVSVNGRRKDVKHVYTELDFSKLRNKCKEFTNAKWCLALDTDERLIPSQWPRLKTLLEVVSEGVGCIYMTILWHQIHGHGDNLQDHRGAFAVARLHRNLPGMDWVWRVHEQVTPSADKLGLKGGDSRLAIIHEGYDTTVDGLRAKQKRNFELLVKQHAETPCDYLRDKIKATVIEEFKINNY